MIKLRFAAEHLSPGVAADDDRDSLASAAERDPVDGLGEHGVDGDRRRVGARLGALHAREVDELGDELGEPGRLVPDAREEAHQLLAVVLGRFDRRFGEQGQSTDRAS